MTSDTQRRWGRERNPARTDAPVAGVGTAPRRWPDRRWLARSIRLVVFLLPIVLSFVVAFVLSGWLGSPDPFWARVVRWVFIAFAATLVMLAAQRLLRRLLPLAALFSLTLVFPDETPSRFGLALRGMSARQLEKKLAAVDEEGLGDTPAEAAESLLALVAALSQHDRLTRGHSERVRAYSVMIGEELDLEADELDQLRWAALLHDVGKLHVPYEVLNKPGKLTDEEFEVIKRHTTEGSAMVAPLADWLGDAAAAVHQHHERFAGGGYPTGVVAEELPQASRIVSVADAFDVMTSARSYKDPASAQAARAELERCAGTQFDPEIVRAMMNISLGKLWRAMGPMSWIAQVGFFPRPLTQGGSAASAVLAALLSMLLTGIAGASQGDTRTQSELARSPVTTVVADVAGGGSGDDPPGAPVEPAPPDPVAPPPVTSATTSTPATATSTTTTSTSPTPTTAPARIPAAPTTTRPSTTRPSTARPPTTQPSTTRPRSRVPVPAPRPRGTIPTLAPPTTATPTTTPASTTAAPPTTTPAATTTTPAATTTTLAATTTTTTTSTTTTTTTTSTTLSPPREFTLAAAGPGDQPSEELLALAPARPPLNPTLTNLDTDRNGDPGLTVIRTDEVMVTGNPEGVQVWRFPDAVGTIDGDVALTLYVAPAGIPAPGPLLIRSGIFDCDLARTNCTRLVRDTLNSTPTAGVFQPITFDLSLPSTPYTAAAGRRLELRFAVSSASSGDVWVGFDAADAPSELVITP